VIRDVPQLKNKNNNIMITAEYFTVFILFNLAR